MASVDYLIVTIRVAIMPVMLTVNFFAIMGLDKISAVKVIASQGWSFPITKIEVPK